jgi:serine/threonine-protein kinase
MTLDEAMLASRIRHPNVVSVLDVERFDDELLLVLDYVEGASLMELIEHARAAGVRLPPRVALRVGLDALSGLHAAHELRDDHGELLGLVHRDVSPHNVLVGVDGIGRLTDFGIAKFARPNKATSTGVLKGKIRYMAPEYIDSGKIDRRSDVFSMATTLWNALTGRMLFDGENPLEIMRAIVSGKTAQLSEVAPELPAALDDVFQMALAVAPEQRFTTALAFSNALSAVAKSEDLSAEPDEVARYVTAAFGAKLEERRQKVKERVTAADSVVVASLPDATTSPSLVRAAATAEVSTARRLVVWPYVAAVLVGAGAAVGAIVARPGPKRAPSALAASEAYSTTSPLLVPGSASADRRDSAPPPTVEPSTPSATVRPHGSASVAIAETRRAASAGSPAALPGRGPREPVVSAPSSGLRQPVVSAPSSGRDPNLTIDPNPFR